jgi:hypothetical protein
MPVRRVLDSFILISLLCLFILAFFSMENGKGNQIAVAASLPQSANPGEPTPQMSISDETCLECHGQPGLTMTLENGDVLDLYVSAEDHAGSVHGRNGYACVQCHTGWGLPSSCLDCRQPADATWTSIRLLSLPSRTV